MRSEFPKVHIHLYFEMKICSDSFIRICFEVLLIFRKSHSECENSKFFLWKIFFLVEKKMFIQNAWNLKDWIEGIPSSRRNKILMREIQFLHWKKNYPFYKRKYFSRVFLGIRELWSTIPLSTSWSIIHYRIQLDSSVIFWNSSSLKKMYIYINNFHEIFSLKIKTKKQKKQQVFLWIFREEFF